HLRLFCLIGTKAARSVCHAGSSSPRLKAAAFWHLFCKSHVIRFCTIASAEMHQEDRMQSKTLSPVESALVTSISRERLMSDTAGIAQWVRLSGTEDERKSVDYVANLVRQMGVEPTVSLGYGYISLPLSAEFRAGGNELRAITHAMSATTPEGGVELATAYVRNGTPQDYA